MKDVYVYKEALELQDAQKVLDVITYLGYKIHVYEHEVPTGNSKFVIDSRFPRWHSWRDVEVAFTETHYPQMVEYNQMRKLDPVSHCVLPSPDDECGS